MKPFGLVRMCQVWLRIHQVLLYVVDIYIEMRYREFHAIIWRLMRGLSETLEIINNKNKKRAIREEKRSREIEETISLIYLMHFLALNRK